MAEQSLQKKIGSFKNKSLIKNFSRRKEYKKSVSYLRSHPFTGFLIGLGILFGTIILGSILTTPRGTTDEVNDSPKTVEIFSLDRTPSLTVQAKVEKEGVIRILAQTPGIVRSVNVKEGENISQGSIFVYLATNYQGANAPGLQASLASAQYNNVSETFTTQKEIIARQREVADKTEANAEEIRKIADESASDTQSLLDLNRDIVNTLNTQLEQAETTGNTTQIMALQQQKSQVQSGVVQLEAQLRQLNYQKDNDTPAAELGVLQRDIAKKQLDIQENALSLSLESSRIQRDLAWIQASLMAPAAPCGGVVERIHVKEGDTVNPGDLIATIKADNNQINLEALLPADLASAVSRTASSTAMINGTPHEITPYYISGEATNGQLYSVLFTLPESVTEALTDEEFISVTVPLSVRNTQDAFYVPLDAVYQTENESYVFVVSGERAESKPVKLGAVHGKFVTVTGGISAGDVVILNRNVVSGERISIHR